VSSVEPSSTTISSKSLHVCASTLSTARVTITDRSNVVITTVNAGVAMVAAVRVRW
jgi:hypothetical protein